MRWFYIPVVDDEHILNFLRFRLKASGHEVLMACNTSGRLERVPGQEPDLIILDVLTY